MNRLRCAVRLAITVTVVAVVGCLGSALAQEKLENQVYLLPDAPLPVTPSQAAIPLRWSVEAPALSRSLADRRGFYELRLAERLNRDAARLPSVVDRPEEGLGLADSVMYGFVRDDAERAVTGATRRAVRNYLLEVSGIEAFRRSRFGGGRGGGTEPTLATGSRGLRPAYDLRLSGESVRFRVGLRGERSRVHFDLGTDGEVGLAWRMDDRFRQSSMRFKYEPDDGEYRIDCRFGF